MPYTRLEDSERMELVLAIESFGTEAFVNMLASSDLSMAGSAEVIPNAIVVGLFCSTHNEFMPRLIADDNGILRNASPAEHIMSVIKHWDEKHN